MTNRRSKGIEDNSASLRAVPYSSALQQSLRLGVRCLICMLARNGWRRASSLTLTRFVRSAQTAAATSRRDEYAAISDRDIEFFRDVLGDRGVVTDPDALQPLNK